ncbi:MAG: hypothetical protein ISR65_19455 [Bacteriovoracaceae bacterium]|nr:hypothetical protein [Bacteriovoracaceae bacterium]
MKLPLTFMILLLLLSTLVFSQDTDSSSTSEEYEPATTSTGSDATEWDDFEDSSIEVDANGI